MIDQQIIFRGRGGGKTYDIMTEMHELIKAGERSTILVVFPQLDYLHWWQREWERRFPFVPMPFYTSMRAMDRVRGRRFKYAYVEDIEGDAEGIYNEKLDYVTFSLLPGGTITFTCRGNAFSDRSHIERKTAASVRREAWAKMRREKEQQRQLEEDILLLTINEYIGRSQQ